MSERKLPFYDGLVELAQANPVEEFIIFMKRLKVLAETYAYSDDINKHFRAKEEMDLLQKGFVNRVILMMFLDYFSIDIEELEDELNG